MKEQLPAGTVVGEHEQSIMRLKGQPQSQHKAVGVSGHDVPLGQCVLYLSPLLNLCFPQNLHTVDAIIQLVKIYMVYISACMTSSEHTFMA